MGAVELQNQSNESNETRINKKKDRFSKLQGISLIIGTLLISIVSGYFISDKFFWNNDDNRLEEQVAYYEGLVSKEPNNPEHRVNLGYSLHLVNKSEEATKQLQIAIDLDKKNVSAYFNLGLVYNDQKRYDDALKQANKAVELAPRDYKGFLLEGMTYRQLKMYDEALKSLQEADKLMPVNNDIVFEIGRVAEDQGKLADAEELYKQALSYDPLYKPASEALARLSEKDSN
ncbi:tetratricopeptide repeat protein [Neobacillus notoginsengisoli]|uniref:Tetratricopeptide repeat protein n=1 Tax=Neobacillus notoginsengisoli TaxID=1578198 RepID=A0A417YRQ8_9BACI|nr:tetratricopeptide repeat protein [Neobacillus notoginsengisoli]RHW37348.1 tetratricopeptide repeat protein [Neobacillus notoginsengisoli]